jgi:hypothetical protein
MKSTPICTLNVNSAEELLEFFKDQSYFSDYGQQYDHDRKLVLKCPQICKWTIGTGNPDLIGIGVGFSEVIIGRSL